MHARARIVLRGRRHFGVINIRTTGVYTLRHVHNANRIAAFERVCVYTRACALTSTSSH